MELDSISPARVVNNSLRIAQFLREISSAAIRAATDNALAVGVWRRFSARGADRQFDVLTRFVDESYAPAAGR
jgi:hypothetical protein